MGHIDTIWAEAKGPDKLRFQNMIMPKGLSINSSLEFGTIEYGPIFKELYLLDADQSQIKKTQTDVESRLVIPTGVEPVFLG